MPRDRVEVLGHSTAPPEAVWAIASDFCGPWHPAIAAIRPERDGRGALVRAFTVHGEATLYRERLTWFSDSDRTLGYTHIEGISDVVRYDGWLSIEAGEAGGSSIRWSATVSAPEPRLTAICSGTKAIFEQGIAVLDEKARYAVPTPNSAKSPATVATEDLILEGTPRLAFTATPAKPGPLCLFLHGIGGARWNWLPQLATAGTVMRAAALDLRGYGGSALGPAPSTVDDYCSDILRLMDALDADRLVLVGLSYGSWLATSFAMRHPDLLAGLVLSGGCTGMSEAEPEEREAFRTSRQVPLDAGQTLADFAGSVVKVLAGPNASALTREELFVSMAAIPASTYRDALHCFTNPPERFDFSRLSMPVLLITGENDRLAPPAEIRGVAKRIHAQSPQPDVRFETIAGAGHVCNIEEPDAYDRILIDFLKGLLDPEARISAEPSKRWNNDNR